MGTVNSRDGKLYLDFRYKGGRCREQTSLVDNSTNRQKLNRLLTLLEQQMKAGSFDYGHHFPDSPKAEYFRQLAKVSQLKASGGRMLFGTFANLWLVEKRVEWRASQIETVEGILRCHLLPALGDSMIATISKTDILGFRTRLCEPDLATLKILSTSRINHIMTYLRLILNEAAERFEFQSPWRNIKALPMPRSEIKPFSLNEVYRIIENVRTDFRTYYLVRFFTGMRTGEIDGLTWEHIDFTNRLIHIRQSLVRGSLGPTKTPGSCRAIAMNQPVYEALQTQREQTETQSNFVFCNQRGDALSHHNVTKRVWYPLLKSLGLEKRNPYQTRHTAATLWLAAGESPEWIARQLGHANTGMLFRVYSRYVPNLLGQDGAAFERLIGNGPKVESSK
ncbi:site-specific integrase [Shewanella profunda]|uniref:tyrosine-type recombinase/integrase n=1 Tax=Shewanella profunda TaxID=254793 RepID=UPI00200D8C05|nr:tyrosine-type recombinase/integrase [Shewanella profunda]MCL1091922.1 site-specific integrase [Shewanella profunda]